MPFHSIVVLPPVSGSDASYCSCAQPALLPVMMVTVSSSATCETRSHGVSSQKQKDSWDHEEAAGFTHAASHFTCAWALAAAHITARALELSFHFKPHTVRIQSAFLWVDYYRKWSLLLSQVYPQKVKYHLMTENMNVLHRHSNLIWNSPCLHKMPWTWPPALICTSLCTINTPKVSRGILVIPFSQKPQWIPLSKSLLYTAQNHTKNSYTENPSPEPIHRTYIPS